MLLALVEVLVDARLIELVVFWTMKANSRGAPG